MAKTAPAMVRKNASSKSASSKSASTARRNGKENTQKTSTAPKGKPAHKSGAKTAKKAVLGNKTNAPPTVPAATLAQLERLRAENLALRKRILRQAATSKANLIPRPVKKRGTSIRMIEAMGLEEDRELYNTIRRFIRYSGMRAGLDFNGRWRDQDKEKLGLVIGSARERFDLLNRFSQAWPVDEILKIQLKNHRQYQRRLEKKMAEVLGENNDGSHPANQQSRASQNLADDLDFNNEDFDAFFNDENEDVMVGPGDGEEEQENEDVEQDEENMDEENEDEENEDEENEDEENEDEENEDEENEDEENEDEENDDEEMDGENEDEDDNA